AFSEWIGFLCGTQTNELESVHESNLGSRSLQRFWKNFLDDFDRQGLSQGFLCRQVHDHLSGGAVLPCRRSRLCMPPSARRISDLYRSQDPYPTQHRYGKDLWCRSQTDVLVHCHARTLPADDEGILRALPRRHQLALGRRQASRSIFEAAASALYGESPPSFFLVEGTHHWFAEDVRFHRREHLPRSILRRRAGTATG